LRNICAVLSAITQLPSSTAAVHRCCLDAAVAAAQAELSLGSQQRTTATITTTASSVDSITTEAAYTELQTAVADALTSAGLLQAVLAAMQRWQDDAELLLLILWYLSAAAASVQANATQLCEVVQLVEHAKVRFYGNEEVQDAATRYIIDTTAAGLYAHAAVF
jgi:hypothetical protein